MLDAAVPTHEGGSDGARSARVPEQELVVVLADGDGARRTALADVAMVGRAAWRRRLDNLTLLAATVSLAVLGNAFICGVMSGPHDRYGARMAWVATLVALIAAVRQFAGDDDALRENSPPV